MTSLTITFELYMKNLFLSLAGVSLLAGAVHAQSEYKILDTTQLMGNGGIDYVTADNDARRVYVPRGGNTYVFDLDKHNYVGTDGARPKRWAGETLSGCGR